MGQKPATFGHEAVVPSDLPRNPDETPAASSRVALAASPITREQMLSNAQAMVEALSDEFGSSVDQWIAELAHLATELHPAADRPVALRQIYRISHEIKGQGRTFGFDLLTSIGHSLCSLISNADPEAPAFRHAVDAHVKAFRLTRRRNICGDGGGVGRSLMEQLRREANAATAPPEKADGTAAT